MVAKYTFEYFIKEFYSLNKVKILKNNYKGN